MSAPSGGDSSRSTPPVSVVIPAYNAARFVGAAVQSTLAQTVTALEVIVVDDGSTDGTVECLAPFAGQVTVESIPNGGVSHARNRGAALARGEWLAFLDADDLWRPDKIERQLARAGAGVGLIYSDRTNIGDRGDVPELQSRVTPMYEGDVFARLLLEGNFVTSSSVMMPRALFERLGGFDETLTASEDWDLWLRVAATSRVALVREPLVAYRFHSASLSHDYHSMWQQRRRVVERALALPQGRALSWRDRQRIWAQTWTSNAAEAVRASERLAAARGFTRAAMSWPFNPGPYREIAKLALGDSMLGHVAADLNRRAKAARARRAS
jgi:glycosyltransferase involved in cell wall biosynthesis